MDRSESGARIPKDKCQLSFRVGWGCGRVDHILGQLNGEVCSNGSGQSVFGSGCPDRRSNKRYCVGRLDLKGNDGARCHEGQQCGKVVASIVFSIEDARECVVHAKHPHVRDLKTLLLDAGNDQTDETAAYAIRFHHQECSLTNHFDYLQTELFVQD